MSKARTRGEPYHPGDERYGWTFVSRELLKSRHVGFFEQIRSSRAIQDYEERNAFPGFGSRKKRPNPRTESPNLLLALAK